RCTGEELPRSRRGGGPTNSQPPLHHRRSPRGRRRPGRSIVWTCQLRNPAAERPAQETLQEPARLHEEGRAALRRTGETRLGISDLPGYGCRRSRARRLLARQIDHDLPSEPFTRVVGKGAKRPNGSINISLQNPPCRLLREPREGSEGEIQMLFSGV